MREIRMLRAMWRELETGPRRTLPGHEGGNPGYRQGTAYGPPRQLSTLPIQMSRGVNTGKPYPNVRPADKSLNKIKAKLTALTGRELTAIPLEDIVGKVNRSLSGWANYFHYRNSSQAMSKVRQHAEDRVRTHLMRRHKVKDRKAALCRFPRRDLYERYGLYKIPTVAGWRSAHALV